MARSYNDESMDAGPRMERGRLLVPRHWADRDCLFGFLGASGKKGTGQEYDDDLWDEQGPAGDR